LEKVTQTFYWNPFNLILAVDLSAKNWLEAGLAQIDYSL